MKKIISIILTLTILLSMSSFTIFASSSALTITTPADGETIENVRTEIKLSNSAADSDFVYEFDGSPLNDAVLTKDMLTIGEHTLTVYEMAQNGDVYQAESTFNVIKQLHDVKTADFNYLDRTMDCTAAAVALYPDPSKTATSTYTVKANRASAKSWAATVTMPDGKNKTESVDDIAVNMTSSSKFSSGAPFFICEFPKIDSVAVFEHDIKTNNTGTILHYEMKYGSNKTWYAGGVATVRYINNGYFFGNSNYPCTPGTWYRLKTVCNFMTGKINVYATNLDTNVTTNVFSDQPITTGVTDLYQVRITYFNDTAGGGITVDNITVDKAPAYTGIKNIEYMYDTELNSDANPDAARLTGLKIYMNEPVIAAVPVTVTDKSGNTITVDDTTKDTATNAIIATLPTGQNLTANTEYNVSVSLSANLAGLTDLATKSFKTAADSYAANEPQFTVGGVKLLTKKQLCGNVLTANVTIDNADTTKPAAFVLAVRDGNKLVGLDIVIPGGGVPVGGDTYTLQTGTLPADMTDATIQIMYLNDINNISTAFATVTKTLN